MDSTDEKEIFTQAMAGNDEAVRRLLTHFETDDLVSFQKRVERLADLVADELHVER